MYVTINHNMKNTKKGAALVWVLMLIVLAIIAGIYFFFFVHVSEAKAVEIVKADYQQKQSIVCNKFMVSSDKCATFIACYAEKATNALPKNLLVQFAKDIKFGKSSAMDSYSLINGKQIGQSCIAQILNIPDNVNINLTDVE